MKITGINLPCWLKDDISGAGNALILTVTQSTLPHPHFVVSNIAYLYQLVFAFIFVAAVFFYIDFGLLDNALANSDRKQFLLTVSAFNPFLKNSNIRQ
jgi:hypothetical protein